MFKIQNLKLPFGRLELIVFISGTVVMILELIGSRILAPYLGTSIFVWASLIGIILGALSLGYYLGGCFSKNNPNIYFLTKILFLGGLTILFIALIKEPVLAFAIKLGVKLGSVIATLLLFTLPSIILGLVSPYVIRLKIERLENSGGVAGNLYALSTIGSIFGTFLAGFYLIPTFGSTQILYGLSFILILTSFLGGKIKLKTITLVIIVFAWLIQQLIGSTYIFETDSAYNHIRVIDAISNPTQTKIRILFLATEPHSVVYQNSEELFPGYNQYCLLDSLFKPEIKNALTLGGGAYISAINFLKRYPEAKMTVVEIDPEVTKVAKDYFYLKTDPRLTIYHEDARIFLNQNQTKYDVIYSDVFASYYSIPFQLTTKEAAEKISNSLTADGILIINLISALEKEKSLFLQAEYKTLKTVFPQIYVFPTLYSDQANMAKHQNIVLIATKEKRQLTKNELLQKANPEQKRLLQNLWEKEIIIDPKIEILTDNFAPVDYYISKLL